METKFNTDFYELLLYDNYGVLCIKENTFLDFSKAKFIRSHCKNHFKNREYVLIHDRKFKHEIDLELFRKGVSPYLKGMAIVSSDDNEKERAITEQTLFDRSYAFFNNMNDAKSWAESFFVNINNPSSI